MLNQGTIEADIQAQRVKIGATQQAYDSHFKQTTKQKSLTIAITVPAISAIQAAQKVLSSIDTVGKSRNNRVNAMAAANAAWDTFRAADSIKSGIDATQALVSGDIQNAGVGVSITYSQQKSEQTQTTEGSTAATSKVNAGGKVNINAEGSEKSHLHINGADISGKQGTHLASSGDVTLSAAEQTHQERSQNKSSGFNAGAAITYGAKGFAMGITAGGNYGKGYGNGDDVTYAYSHIGDKQSQTTITSGKTTALLGTQVYGEKVKLDTDNLKIESLQETMTYKGKQQNISGQLTVGYGASVSGSYNQSKVNSDYASVIEQSGIYAGDGGYQVNVQNHTEMTGGIMTSTEKAEAENRNRIETGTLSTRDVQNYSRFSSSGFGLSGGFTVTGDFHIPLGGKPTATQSNSEPQVAESSSDKQVVKTIEGMGGREMGKNTVQSDIEKQKTNTEHGIQLNGITGIGSQGAWGMAKGLATGLLGHVSDSGSETGVTTSSINTQNIIIRDSETQQTLTGKTVAQTIKEINKENQHKAVEKVDIDKVKSDLEQDLSIARDFVDNLNQIGDKLYYEVEKNKNNLVVKYKPQECKDPSCLRIFELDMEQIRNRDLTEDEVKILSRVYVHGILNTTDKDRVEGAIQYTGKEALQNATVVVRKPYAGLAEELTYTVFERVRAGLNLPSIFGASNASKDQVTIWEKLNEYNKNNPNKAIDLRHVAHSLGASSTKNAMNWANYQGLSFDDTNAKLVALGTSYPIHSDLETGYFDTARGLFNKTRLDYSIAPKDCVGTCTLIGRTPSTADNTNVGTVIKDLLPHHTAYIRDKEVFDFYFNKLQSKDYEIKLNSLKQIWDIKGEYIGPKFNTLEGGK